MYRTELLANCYFSSIELEILVSYDVQQIDAFQLPTKNGGKYTQFKHSTIRCS